MKFKYSGFLSRLKLSSFNVKFVILYIYFGISSFLGLSEDQFFELTAGRLQYVFLNILFIFAGLCVLYGLGSTKTRYEAVGLILLITYFFIRTLSVLYFFGPFTLFINPLAFYRLIGLLACIFRLHTIKHSRTFSVSINGK